MFATWLGNHALRPPFTLVVSLPCTQCQWEHLFLLFYCTGFLRSQYGAITVYRASSGNQFLEGASPSTLGLVDAIVYSQNAIHNPLSRVLTPDSVPVSIREQGVNYFCKVQ